MALPTDTPIVRSDPLRDRIDDILSSLPSSYVLAARGDARLVVGPLGAFVLLPGGTDPARVAEQLGRLTAVTREALFDHLTWVPFLDALVVTKRATPRHHTATVVPLDLLADLLTEGRPVIDGGTLNAIREALRTGQLDGWQVGTGTPGASIDLCDPVQPTALPG